MVNSIIESQWKNVFVKFISILIPFHVFLIILNVAEEFSWYVNFSTGCTEIAFGEWPAHLNADKEKYQTV